MRITLTLLSTMLLFGCADTETKNRLGNAAANCIVSAARTMDDGVSPANTVAYGVMSRCQRQIDAYDSVRLPSGRGFNVHANAAWDNRHIGWMSQITAVVLEQRASNRQQNNSRQIN